MSINNEDKNEPIINNTNSDSDCDNDDENKCFKAVKIVSGIIIILLGLAIGIIFPIIILLIIAEKTENAIIAYIIQFIIMMIIISVFTFIGICTCGAKKLTSCIIGIIISLIIWALIFVFLCLIFYLPVDNDSVFYKNINETYWEFNTSKISYIKYEGSNTTTEYPIIFVHGGPGEPVNGTQHFLEELVLEGYEVYQYDQFGCGNSNRATNPKEYTVERHISDLEEIRKKIGAEKIILISHSWGGSLVSSYMAKYNDKVLKSIFISPKPICEDDNSSEIFTKEGNEDINNALKDNKRFYISGILTNLVSETGLYYLMSEDKLDKLFMNFHDNLNMKPGSGENYKTKGAGYGFWASIMTSKSFSDMDCNYENLTKSDAECLVIRGQFDYLSLKNTVLYRDKINNSTLILIDGMGHCVEEKYESIISKNIISFLKNGTTINKPYEEK